MKSTSVAFISTQLKKEWELLRDGKFEDKELYSFIDNAINELKENRLCGIKIPARLWPKEYVKNYRITNLWKFNLPNGWRLIYTIESDEVTIISIILEWFTHKDYERRFGY